MTKIQSGTDNRMTKGASVARGLESPRQRGARQPPTFMVSLTLRTYPDHLMQLVALVPSLPLACPQFVHTYMVRANQSVPFYIEKDQPTSMRRAVRSPQKAYYLVVNLAVGNRGCKHIL